MQPDSIGILLAATAFFLAAGLFIMWIWAIVHCLNNPLLDTGSTRIAWILILIFLHLLGGIIYFIVAPRPLRDRTGPPGPPR